MNNEEKDIKPGSKENIQQKMPEEQTIPEENKNVSDFSQFSSEKEEGHNAEPVQLMEDPSSDPIPSTPNHKPSTEMEVHHHGHIHEKNKWKEYLFQFLMLFLAVTLGFFVENQREHYIEHKRALGLVSSLVTDLQKDTSLLNWLNDFRNDKRKSRLDSFYLLLSMPAEKIDKSQYYSLMYNIAEYYSFSQSTGTINQLKNAGYLRYFSDSKLLNYISEYDFLVQDLKIDETTEFHLHYDKLMQLLKQHSDIGDMHAFYAQGVLPRGIGIIPFKPEILQSIRAHLIELIWYNQPQMIKQNERVKKRAVEIIKYLQTKYHVK